MEIGQLVDYVMQYNDSHDPDRAKEEKKKAQRRKAVQADWDALMG